MLDTGAQIGKGVHFDEDYKIVTQYGGGSMIKPGSYDRYVVFKNNPEADFNCIAWPMGLLQVSCNPFKEKALKETESKQVVIDTYAMASEALDIKTLTTLIMATPKTDIEQSVGRILRERHSQPIVVDIIDTHQLFQNQWRKRKIFYKKENYKIVYNSTSNILSKINKTTKTSQTSKTSQNISSILKNIGINGISKKKKKSSSERSNSSSDKSIAVETDEDEDEDENENEDEDEIIHKPVADKYLCGKCFLLKQK
jgi:hypothetical protein